MRAPLRSWSATLCAVTFCLFVATTLLYIWENKHRAVLSQTVTNSGWVAYQAQLEHVKSAAAIEHAKDHFTPQVVADLALRLEILRSRLPILYASEEGRILPEIAAMQPALQAYERLLDRMIDELPALHPPDAGTPEMLARWASALAPLGPELQTVLMASVAYNNSLFERERTLATQLAIVPLALLFLSGTSLVAMLLLQSRRDTARIAEVERARRAIADMEGNLRGVIQAAPTAMAVIDPSRNAVRFVNPAAAQMVAGSLDHPDWKRLIEVAAQDVRTGDAEGATVKMALTKANGDVISLRGHLCPVTWEGRPQVLVVMIDTTRAQHADLQSLQAAKLAALGEMANALSHEINQPLAVIRMAVANAHRHLETEGARDAVAAKLERVSTQVDRAKRIIEQVRHYGRLPSGTAEIFPLGQAIELAAGSVAEQYRSAGIRLALQLDLPPEHTVSGDRAMLEHVIVNLLVNARDAFALQDDTRPRTVWLRAQAQEGRAVIEVEDAAGGISDDLMSRIFEPFSTTKVAQKGTGLGLALARSVVRDMNGQIMAENMRYGACFTLVLPLAPAAASSAEREAA
ncbi:sensor histidine kinase [Aquabacter cavernae]|uniref:sensor histidine kinase n=1 Tax=Aquabacter cavernae TaxID=2496029 RepID=UPI000F8D3C98|nr:ATP-binding protein [Aquabacter cavernae]